MKKEIVEYACDSFVDFKGKERKIVACALSQTPKSNDDCKMVVGWKDIDEYVEDYSEICRAVTVGITVCNPSDTFNLDRGMRIAYSRALNDPNCPTLYTTTNGVINKSIVNAFLQQEIDFIKKNPERIIKGYDEAKERFERNENLKKEIQNLSPEESAVFDLAVKGVDVEK